MDRSSASPSWETSTPETSSDSLPRCASPSPSPEDLIERLDDPFNRFYRYPVANALLRVFGWLPFRPDHVTFFHAFVGVGAAAMVAFGSRPWLYAAFVLLELRSILDCYDGVLARFKKLSSPRGRALDELADGAAYVALVVGIAIRTAREGRVDLAIGLFFVLVILGAMSAHACDFYRRRLRAVFRGEPNAVAAELERKKAIVASGNSRWLDRFGVWFDGWQITLFEPRNKRSEPDAGDPRMPALVFSVAMLGWDNGLAIMHAGVLSDRILPSCAIAIGYGCFMMLVTIAYSRRVLGGRR